MGCLLEGIGFVIEASLEMLIEACCEFLSGWVPERMKSETLRKTIKAVIYLLTLCAVFSFLFGIAVAVFSEATVFDMRKFIFIPLGFFVFETLLVIIAKIKRKG